MENKEKKQIPDDLLRLAAGRYMKNRGEKLLEEAYRLNREKKYQPTEKELKNFRKLCNREFRKKNRKVAIPYKVALAAAVILIVFNISMFTVPAVKQVALDFMTKAEKTHTVINKEDGERNTVENATNYEKYRVKMEEEYQITYLPEGFYAAKEERMLQKISMDYKNINDENKMICFSQNKENTTVNADTENAVVDYVDINGEKALLAQKNDVINITWKIGKYFISITSQEIDRDELIKVAKSVKKVK